MAGMGERQNPVTTFSVKHLTVRCEVCKARAGVKCRNLRSAIMENTSHAVRAELARTMQANSYRAISPARLGALAR